MATLDINEYRLLMLPEVCAITGLSRNTILRLVKAKLFPPPIRIGPRAVAWRWSDIRAWLESRPLVTGEENWQ